MMARRSAPSVLQHANDSAKLTPETPRSVRCRLCKQPPVEPTHLNCKHTFCYQCLYAYVERGRYMNSLDFPCPHCRKLSAPPWGTWHLSHKVTDRSHDELYQTWRYEAMCDNCACDGLYATAGRHCSQCNIHLCDTCAFAHSVMPDTRNHGITTQVSKIGSVSKVIGENEDVSTGKYMGGNEYISLRRDWM
ncbi:uncharacterized protein [Watersipora subatra]|uniref:uncharacterized protein n=1 Tax=Watersipora subatra TaxID=2589382 RepID=UPI00355AF73F